MSSKYGFLNPMNWYKRLLTNPEREKRGIMKILGGQGKMPCPNCEAQQALDFKIDVQGSTFRSIEVRLNGTCYECGVEFEDGLT